MTFSIKVEFAQQGRGLSSKFPIWRIESFQDMGPLK